MKRTILQISIFILTMSFAFGTQAQVTITQENYLRLSAYTDSLVLAPSATLPNPTEGPAQVWDYSALIAEDIDITAHFDAGGNVDFPNATSYYRSDRSFQGFPIESYVYEAVDASGWYVIGDKEIDVTYSITTITGGANDILRFPGGNLIPNATNDLINFPMNYQDQWTVNYIEITPYELSIAAFGLNETPGNLQRAISSTREIVGYGELTIPKWDGSPSDPMEVLLMKTTSVAVDSVFLGGAPAPDALMAAFGLVQGATVTSSSYLFYRPGFGSAVLFTDAGPDSDYSYRPQAANISTGIKSINLAKASSFPNPVLSGDQITISSETIIQDGIASFYDLNGRLAFETSLNSGSGNQFQVRIPEKMIQGLYMYQISNQNREPVAVGKLQIN